jgi:protein-tyrosine-phosphatase
MAEAMFNATAPAGWRAISAGTRPAARPNARTGPMLSELDLRLPDHPPQALRAEWLESAELRVTMGCLDDASCPVRLTQLRYRDWALPDPGTLDDTGFRGVRDRLRVLVSALVEELAHSERVAPDGPRPPE